MKGKPGFENSLSVPCFTSETVGKPKAHVPHLLKAGDSTLLPCKHDEDMYI